MRLQTGDRQRILLASAIALAAIAVFSPTLSHGFIELYDDGQYVTGNPAVLRGLSAEGIAWAFGHVHGHNWIPLTWLSHMLDVTLFGLDPRGHHLSSVLLHGANAALVFLLLSSLLGRPGMAALVALGFALHPLRLQSVAWIAERKDLLTAFFGLASLVAYTRHARTGGRGAYLTALALLAAGLLAKPMLVTWPAVMLLVDAWPLGRLSAARPDALRAALLEKLPFAALALAGSAMAVIAQGGSGAVAPGELLPLGVRLANAAVSVFAYLAKLAWPASLSVFYPHPGVAVLGWPALAAITGLAAISAAVLLARRRIPALAFGWAWFLVTLLPVLGIVQVGRQAYADRYTYLPSIGVLLAFAFAIDALAERLSPALAPRVAGTVGGAACAALALATQVQLPAWRDSEALFLHARAVTARNAVAANALGILAAREGRLEEARGLYAEAVEDDASFAVARQNLAGILLALGRPDEAFPHAAAAARLDPASPPARYVHGVALELHGLIPEAAAEYEAALALRPDYESARQRLDALRQAVQPGRAP